MFAFCVFVFVCNVCVFVISSCSCIYVRRRVWLMCVCVRARVLMSVCLPLCGRVFALVCLRSCLCIPVCVFVLCACACVRVYVFEFVCS